MAVTEAIIAVTMRCNARCTMCDVWQGSGGDEVAPEFYRFLPTTLTHVNITGGEPFLRKDLDRVVEVISQRCPGVRPVISTNGLLPQRIRQLMPKILKVNPRVAVRVSVDGIGKTHDEIRGVDGAYEKALTSLAILRELGIKDRGVGFTLMRANQDQMMEVFDFATREGLQFTSTVAHSSPIFFGDQKDQSPDTAAATAAFESLMNRQLKSRHPKDWFRAYFTEGVIDMLAGRSRKVDCPSLLSFFYLDPSGMVFPCHILDEPIGRLSDAPFAELVAKVEGGADKYRCCTHQCWMTCTVAPKMRKNPHTIALWIARAKLRQMVGK